jgi:hypothetical protein
MGSHIGLANELLITAVQTIWVSHDQIIYKYMLPIVIINELVVIIITILVYSNRNEIEICSRNNAFLLQLFTSLNLASVTALLLAFTTFPSERGVLTSLLGMLLLFFYLLYLSALNCRLRLVRLMLRRPKAKNNYFVPWSYHSVVV